MNEIKKTGPQQSLFSADEILKRWAVMKSERARWEPMWDKAAELCAINSDLFLSDEKGRVKQSIFDSTARNALTCFTASLKSVLIPSTSRWHRLKTTLPMADEDSEVKKYLERVTDLLFNVRYGAHSNFASEADIVLQNLGIYGHAVWMVEDNVGQGIVYHALPVKDAYVERNDCGQLKAVFRKYRLRAVDALQKFGREALDFDIITAANNTPDKKFQFLHAVFERDDYNPMAKDFCQMKYASVHLDVAHKKIISVGGYESCPYMAPRFLPIAGSSYGDSPAMQAFYDMLTANEMGKTILRTGQLQANPPILTNMGLIDANKLGSAGAVIRGGLDNQGKPAAVSMQYGNNLAITVEMQREIRASIERAFLVPLFQSLTQSKQMTATEVEKRELEKTMLLAPMCERIFAEWLAGNVERELQILSRYGALDGVPDALMRAGSIAIEFENPVVHAQKGETVNGLYKMFDTALSISQVNPAILDVLDMENAMRQIADYLGVGTNVVRTADDVNNLRFQALLTAEHQADEAKQGEADV